MQYTNNKPYSQACENNKAPILAVLRQVFADTTRVLEIGSGTGQHAVYFAEHLPHLFWQTSDRQYCHDGIIRWIDDFPAKNIGRPIDLNVETSPWPTERYDGIFSANTAHIMSWEAVQEMFRGIGALLSEGQFALYGPFNRDGQFTCESNHRFHLSLVQSNPRMGIRDDQAIFTLAAENGLCHRDDFSMPANNRLLVFDKSCR